MKPEYTWIYWLLGVMAIALIIKFGWKLVTKPWSHWMLWSAVHVLLFAPLLLYVAWKKKEAPQTVFSLLLAVGIAALGYHIVRIAQKAMAG